LITFAKLKTCPQAQTIQLCNIRKNDQLSQRWSYSLLVDQPALVANAKCVDNDQQPTTNFDKIFLCRRTPSISHNCRSSPPQLRRLPKAIREHTHRSLVVWRIIRWVSALLRTHVHHAQRLISLKCRAVADKDGPSRLKLRFSNHQILKNISRLNTNNR
jgi:hypothetical protein